MGDFNGDGRLDFAVPNAGNSNVSVRLNTTTPGAAMASYSAAGTFAVGASPISIATTDFNGDGRVDMAVASYDTNNVSVLLNTTEPGAANPSFAAATNVAVGIHQFFLAAGDINGDGRPDLAVAHQTTNHVSVLLNTTMPGAATPTFTPDANVPVGGNAISVALGDVNGDGRPDLAVGNGNTVSVRINTTSLGASAPSFTAGADFTSLTNTIYVGLGDVNGDGRSDLAVADFIGGNVLVLLNTTAPGAATPSFSAPSSYATGALAISIATRDLNGDGRPDLAVANQGSDNVSVLLNIAMPGATTPAFAAPVNFATGAAPRSVATEDFNGDGRPDLAVASQNSDEVSVLLNRLYSVDLGNNEALATIVDDDASSLSIADIDRSEGDTGSTNFTFTVTRSGATGTATVNYATANGGASAAEADYVTTSGNLTFNPGETSKIFTVQANGDSKFELDETFAVSLSSPVGATISGGTAIGTILNDDAEPSVRFTQAARTVSETAGTVSLDVELSNPSYLPVSFSVTGDAASGADYSGLTTGPITIPADATSALVSLSITDDAIDEADEVVSIQLGSPINATLGSPNSLALTIQDNDAAPTAGFADATLSFDEGAGTVASRVQLSAPSGQDVTVPIMLTGGTADGADYALLSASPVTIPAGETFVDLSIQITDDLLDEANETITLQLGAPTHATITVPFTQTVTITDNDATPTVSFDTAGASYDEAAGTVMIPVRLSAASGQVVTAGFSVGGSATAADFDTPTASPLSFPVGSTAVNIVLNLTDDALDEVDETVGFTLSAPSNATLGVNTAFTATIEDNDNAPTVAFEMASRSVLENAGTVTVDVVLSAASGKDVSFTFGSGGTAGAADFGGLTVSPVTILAGATRASLSVTVTDDALDEPDETLVLSLLSAVNASVGVPAGFTLTVQDNDDAPTVSFTVAAQSADESAGTVSAIAQLSGPSAFDVTVPFSVTGTAGGADFTLLSASPLMIQAGATQATVSVSLLEDVLDEDPETIAISLQAATNATVVAPSTHTVTIADNDAAPSVSFTVSAQNVAESAGTATVALQLSAVSGKPISVPLSFGGSASAPGDYSASAASIAIPAGSTGGSITLSIVNDAAFESPNETVLVTASAPTNASLASPAAQTVTIVDDDAQAVASIVLAPATASLPTLSQHCVVATTRDSVGTALSGIPLSFTVTGVNPNTGAVSTNASGNAQFCFNGVNAGTDTITASFMTQMGTATIVWNKRNTGLTVAPVPAVIVTQGLQLRILISPIATLRDTSTNSPIVGRTVNFSAGSTALCTAVTDANGVATCPANLANTLAGLLSLGYTGSFNGDNTYNLSAGNGGILGLKLF